MSLRIVAPRPTARPRALATAGLTAAAALLLSGCQITSPVTTDMIYDPADGVSVDVGDVAVRDLLVVSEGNGAAGAVSGLVVNNTGEPVQVTLTLDVNGQAQPLEPAIEVPVGGAVRLDGMGDDDSEAMTVPAVETYAGGTLNITVTTDQGEASAGLAPILLPEGVYSDHVVATADVAQ